MIYPNQTWNNNIIVTFMLDFTAYADKPKQNIFIHSNYEKKVLIRFLRLILKFISFQGKINVLTQDTLSIIFMCEDY